MVRFTSNEIGYFSADAGIAFVGDTAGVRVVPNGFVLPPTPPPDINIEIWQESLTTIEQWRPETALLTHFGPASPTGPHISELRDRLGLVGSLAKQSLDIPGEDQDREAWYVTEIRRELHRHLTDGDAASYENSGPFDLNWRGLAVLAETYVVPAWPPDSGHDDEALRGRCALTICPLGRILCRDQTGPVEGTLMGRISFRVALAFAFGLAMMGRAEATPFIPDRATLETLLLGSFIGEDFERYRFTTSTLNDLVASTLNSQTITSSFTGNPSPQGPGLVADGVEFYGGGFLWWTQAGAGGWGSQAIYSGGHIFSMVDTINIRFTQPTTAFGVDVVALFDDSPETLTATVFAPDLLTVLGTSQFVLDGPTAPVFVGFGDPGGVGLVELRTSRLFVSPAIDNLAFGPAPAVIPEPASAVLLLASGLAATAGLRRRRRKKSIHA